MIEIFLAIASMVAGEAAATYLAVTGWQAAAVRFAVALAISTASKNLITRKSFQSEAEGRIVTTKEPLSAAKVIYGRVRVGGTIVFMETTSSSNEYLHIIIVLAGHEVYAIDDIYFDDELVNLDGSGNATGTYANYARIEKGLGTDNQTAFANLVSESGGLWTANHRLRGRACLYVRLKYSQDKFPNGIPNITAIVRGKKVYDPRSATTTYSTNPALIVADYLTNTRYGLAASFADEIDQTALTAAANICDEDVDLKAGGTEDRYTANGSFDTTEIPEKILAELCSSMAGYVTYVGGKWVILAGAYRSPSISLDESDLRSGFKVQTLLSRRDQFNSVKGVFSSPDNLWQPTDFPSFTSNTFVVQDDNEVVYRDISLPFTTSAATAQRLSKIELYKAREQLSLTLPCKLSAYSVQVGDVVQVTNTRLGWSAKDFEVVGTKISFDIETGFGVDLDLRETNSALWTWDETNEEIEYIPAPNTNLPNPISVPAPTGLTLTETKAVANDGSLVNAIRVSWTAPSDVFIKFYEVQYIRTGGSVDYGLVSQTATSTDNWGSITSSATASFNWGSVADAIISGEPEYNAGNTSTTQLTIAPIIQSVTYTVRVRSVSQLDVRSAFVTSTITTSGDTVAPGAPANVIATGGLRSITVSWENPSDTDLDLIEIYRNTTNNSSTSVKVGSVRGSSFIDSPLGSSVTYYYFLKALDRSGNRSVFSTGASGTSSEIVEDDFSTAVMNLFAEAGAYGIEPVSSLPGSGDFVGQIKFDTTAVALYRWTGTAWTDDIFSIESGSVTAASFAAGIEPISVVTTLPSASGYTGPKVVFVTSDGKLYRYVSGAWTTAVLASDLSGSLASSNFPSGLRPVEVVSSLPSADNFAGRMAFLTTDAKLYRHDGSNWVASVSTSDLSGTIENAQIAGLAASKITGQLTNSQIADVAAAKLTGTLVASQIAASAIDATKLADTAVTTAKIALAAVTADVIAAGAITAPKIESGAVTNVKLAADSVTAEKISAGAITTGKIDAGAITAEKIAAAAITAGKIAADAVTANEIAANAVTADKINASAVTAAKIDASAVTAEKIAAGAVVAEKIDAAAVTTAKLAAGAVTADTIAANAITTAKLEAGAVTTAKIAAGTILASNIAAATITGSKIASGTITASNIAADTITSGVIAAGAITSSELASNSVIAGKIAAGAISASTLFVDGVITSSHIASGTIQGNKIAANTITGGLLAASGIITSAAQISNAVITNAKIDTAAVTTLKIAGNAVTVPSGVYSSSQVDVGTVSSLTFNVEDVESRWLISGGVTLRCSDLDNVVNLRIDGNTVASWYVNPIMYNSIHSLPISYIIASNYFNTTGNHTVSLYVTGALKVFNRSLVATGIKR